MTAVVLGAPDVRELAGFYRRLLGWEVAEDGDEWLRLVPPGGGVGLSFQAEAEYVPPKWPARPGDQQMMMHLDIEVDDLEAAAAHAEALGAKRAGHQPQEDVLVLLDPAGHPFCLWTR
ncbi:VOC family protein [Bailinhaonella thermotolerans]|uniref:VOC family protein n=1 Tax=Bailinhaonella thermotolerans TaxID=1070861 RepID=A0A3A4ARL1_9ACTN|nr:VOC family protein [Bailinhaonella thermotolerans]